MDQRFPQLVRAGRGLLEMIGSEKNEFVIPVPTSGYSSMSCTKSGDSECTVLDYTGGGYV